MHSTGGIWTETEDSIVKKLKFIMLSVMLAGLPAIPAFAGDSEVFDRISLEDHLAPEEVRELAEDSDDPGNEELLQEVEDLLACTGLYVQESENASKVYTADASFYYKNGEPCCSLAYDNFLGTLEAEAVPEGFHEEGKVLLDNELAAIILEGEAEDSYYVGYNLVIENKSDQYILVGIDNGSIDGGNSYTGSNDRYPFTIEGRSGGESADSESMDGKRVLVDNELATITLGDTIEESYYVGYSITIENKSDLYLLVGIDNGSVDGFMTYLDVQGGSVSPGKKSKAEIRIYTNDDSDVKSLEDLKNVEGEFKISTNSDGGSSYTGSNDRWPFAI